MIDCRERGVDRVRLRAQRMLQISLVLPEYIVAFFAVFEGVAKIVVRGGQKDQEVIHSREVGSFTMRGQGLPFKPRLVFLVAFGAGFQDLGIYFQETAFLISQEFRRR